jgi:hypothetical protein
MTSVQRVVHRGSIAERIEAKVVRVPFSGCWLFTGSLDTSGYGLIGVGGSGNIGKAHRENFKHYRGAIPDGMQVLHECDVRCCVNPRHLFLGSLQDNMDDRDRKGRHVAMRGERHGMSKLTAEQVREIRSIREATGMGAHRLAKKFGVAKFTVARIINGEGWKGI